MSRVKVSRLDSVGRSSFLVEKVGVNGDITCRLAGRMPERERKNLDVRLGILSVKVEGQELVFRELRLVSVKKDEKAV